MPIRNHRRATVLVCRSDGNPRFADDQATADTGCGVPVVVDRGAYELSGEAFAVKLGDIDGDGVVAIAEDHEVVTHTPHW